MVDHKFVMKIHFLIPTPVARSGSFVNDACVLHALVCIHLGSRVVRGKAFLNQKYSTLTNRRLSTLNVYYLTRRVFALTLGWIGAVILPEAMLPSTSALI